MKAGSAPPQKNGAPRIVNAFTVDIEDYFQVEAFKGVIDPSAWERWPARVTANTERVLALLKSANVRATFFVLGWIADRFPEVVYRIAAEGHEVASHGFGHARASTQTAEEFREDVRRAKGILEDLSGTPVRGYRAPTFSISAANSWTYDVLAREGYQYSSSVYPISHDLYDAPDAPRMPYRPSAAGTLLEIPLATVRLFGANRPCGGGGYFRLFPYAVSRWSIRRVNAADAMPTVFYCHPWEFDPDQPRVPGISLKSRFRHYVNLGAMERRIARLLHDFAWGRMDEIFLMQAAGPAAS